MAPTAAGDAPTATNQTLSSDAWATRRYNLFLFWLLVFIFHILFSYTDTCPHNLRKIEAVASAMSGRAPPDNRSWCCGWKFFISGNCPKIQLGNIFNRFTNLEVTNETHSLGMYEPTRYWHQPQCDSFSEMCIKRIFNILAANCSFLDYVAIDYEISSFLHNGLFSLNLFMM